VKFSKVSDKKSPRIYTNLSLFNCKHNISSIITPVKKSSYFVTGISEVSTETTIGIPDAHLFNTDLAIPSRAIIKYGCFQLS